MLKKILFLSLFLFLLFVFYYFFFINKKEEKNCYIKENDNHKTFNVDEEVFEKEIETDFFFEKESFQVFNAFFLSVVVYFLFLRFSSFGKNINQFVQITSLNDFKKAGFFLIIKKEYFLNSFKFFTLYFFHILIFFSFIFFEELIFSLFNLKNSKYKENFIRNIKSYINFWFIENIYRFLTVHGLMLIVYFMIFVIIRGKITHEQAEAFRRELKNGY